MSDTEAVVNPAIAKKIGRAMECIAKVARLYKKYGKPPIFMPIETVYNPPRQRIRLAAVTTPPVENVCGRCHLLFIGSANTRCQCKVRMKKGT